MLSTLRWYQFPVREEKKKEAFDLYRPATGLERVPESTNIYQGQNCKVANLVLECYIIVEVLSQNTEFVFWSCFVNLVEPGLMTLKTVQRPTPCL